MRDLRCTSADLADCSGLSVSAISKYRNGSRIPKADSEIIRQLASGLSVCAHKQRNISLSEQQTYITLSALCQNDSEDICDCISENLDTLIDALSINLSNLAQFLNYDISFISKICSKARKPADTNTFLAGCAEFIVSNYRDIRHLDILSALMKQNIRDTSDAIRYRCIMSWMSTKHEVQDGTSDFLHKIDDFNLDEFISKPPSPISIFTRPLRWLASSNNYFGIDGLKKGIIDFFTAVFFSKSADKLIFLDDMPIEELLGKENNQFFSQAMLAVSAVLKKNLHITALHFLNRPIREIMLGLEFWVPLYMTGLIAPFSLDEQPDKGFHHVFIVSNHYAFSGEALYDHPEDGIFTLTRNSQSVSFWQQSADSLLKRATPLMQIYRKEQAQQFADFLSSDVAMHGSRKMIVSVPPVYTMNDALIDRVLWQNSIAPDSSEALRIKEYIQNCRKQIDRILENDTITVYLFYIPEEEFEDCPVSISLPGLFSEQNIYYRYSEYAEHIQATEKFAARHERFVIKKLSKMAFRNIQIEINESKYTIISKDKAPSIHFVIFNDKIIHAINQLAILNS